MDLRKRWEYFSTEKKTLLRKDRSDDTYEMCTHAGWQVVSGFDLTKLRRLSWEQAKNLVAEKARAWKIFTPKMAEQKLLEHTR
ncbi:MAG: hypothetical protein KW788_02970 [Candidatus Doudnabacteria bacterium]|nr:hypothetical protein [Candidatus Doudnabacteria bacterium]